MSKHFGFMLWRNDEHAMRPVTDSRNCLLVYAAYELAERHKPALGVISPITSQDATRIVSEYRLAGLELRGSENLRRGKNRDY